MIRFRNSLLYILAIMLIASSHVPARTLNLRTLAMGSAGVAVIGSAGPISSNPASLFYQTDAQLLINTVASNTFVPYAREQQETLPAWQTPRLETRFLFSSRFLALTIELENILSERTVASTNDSVSFVANNYSNLQLNVAYGNDNVAIGLYARGGTHMERSVTLDTVTPFAKYVQQAFFERYYPIPENQFFNAGAGVLLGYEWITLGLATESLFEMNYDTNQLVLDAGSVIDDLVIGFSFKTPKYDKNDELNLLVFTSAVDVSALGDDQKRKFHVGGELKFQLSPDYEIAIQTGYSESRTSLGSLFSLNGTEGLTTFGLSGSIGNFAIHSLLTVPLSAYDGSWLPHEEISLRIGMMLNP